MHGATGQVLGIPNLPSMASVKSALSLYDMNVVDAAFGVATDAGGRSTPRRDAALQRNDAYARSLEASGARVLRGMLQDWNQADVPMQEKKVDVLCAVEVVKLAIQIAIKQSTCRAIVVLSADKDLAPAIDMARQELDVPVYAAAARSVHQREGSWILLGEDAVRQLGGPPSNTALLGEARRTALALEYLSPNPSPWVCHIAANGQKTMRSVGSALSGVMQGGGTMPGTNPLYCVGIDTSELFPRAILSTAPATGGQVLSGRVHRRKNVEEVTVQVPGISKNLTVKTPVGYPVPQADVLLVEDSRNPSRHIYVGTVAQSPGLAASNIGLVTLIGKTRKGDGYASLEGTPDKVIVKLPLEEVDTAIPGDRFAVVLAERLNNSQRLTWAVSSKLPKR